MATYTNIHNPGGFTSLEDTCILETHSMMIHVVEPVEALAETPDEALSQSKVGQTKRESERRVGLQHYGSQARSAVWSRRHPVQDRGGH